jgi:hypothetical protein
MKPRARVGPPTSSRDDPSTLTAEGIRICPYFRFSLNGAYDAVYVTLATAIAASGDEVGPGTI